MWIHVSLTCIDGSPQRLKWLLLFSTQDLTMALKAGRAQRRDWFLNVRFVLFGLGTRLMVLLADESAGLVSHGQETRRNSDASEVPILYHPKT